MKHLKNLVVVLVVLMGVSLTSCMGEADPNVSWTMYARVVNTYPYTFQDARGVKFIATNNAELVSQSIKMNNNDVVYIQYTYNSKEQVVTDETKQINAKITFGYNASTAANSDILAGNGAGSPYENATVTGLYSLEEGGVTYFDKNTLMLSVKYLALKDLALHTFTLVYDTTNDNADGVMNLYLRHSHTEEKPNQNVNGYYRAFDISSFLAEYGKTPTKIKIWVNETDKLGSDSLGDAKKELQSYEIEYKSLFEKK